LPEGTTAQRTELIALTQALWLAKEKNINIYTDSRYAFTTADIHGTIYRQTGLLTSAGKDIKKNLEPIRSHTLAKNLAIIHCPGHEKGHDAIAKENQMANLAAKQTALREK
jgi:ribonuclease HI